MGFKNLPFWLEKVKAMNHFRLSMFVIFKGFLMHTCMFHFFPSEKNIMGIVVYYFLLFSHNPLYSDGFSHTDKYNKDWIVHYIF